MFKQTVSGALACAILGGVLVAAAPARAERRPPFGNDAAMLESRVREDIERRIRPLLDEMAPGQVELKYVDVRVTRPTALPAGAAPGFEELTPGTEFVAERADVELVEDAKLPAQFRKDLKKLIESRLEALAVPVDIKETVISFPTPRPQPTPPREPMPWSYPPAPREPAAQTPAAAAPTPPPPPPRAPEVEATARGIPWALAIALAILGALIGALAVALVTAFAARRAERKNAGAADGRAAPSAGEAGPRAAAAPAADHLPEVRRALREDRVLARRVMGELLRENQLDKVAMAVELVGPSVVEDLRADPSCVVPLREAAALLVDGRLPGDTREAVAQLHRRILKHRMVGADDPVEQEFAFLLGLSATRLGAVLAPEHASVQAATLRYAPAHLRAAYLADRSPAERSALAAALAAPKTLARDHLLDVATTLRARAAELAHLDAGETGDLDLAVELLEERPADEQASMLEAMRRADPAKARAVQAALITDRSLERVPEEVLAAAAIAVPSELLARYLRDVPEAVATRTLGALPRSVAQGLEEDLSLAIATTPQQIADARRAVFAALRKALRDRGLTAPDTQFLDKTQTDTGKVVAL
jgi:flagellar motor switch protein FliG